MAELAAALKRAETRLHELTIRLAVARSKDDTAQSELQNARREYEREILRAKLTQLVDAGLVVDECIASLKQALSVVCPLMDDLRSEGHDMLNLKLNDAQVFFRQRLLDSCGAMRGCRTGLDVFVKRASWAETLPQPDQAEHVRFTLPAAKPIPGWQIGE
jgi:hypothetical protein